MSPYTAAAVAGRHSARTTDLGERLIWVAALVAVVLGIYLLMWRAWKRRGARQGDLPDLPAPPPTPGPGAPPAELELTGRYHGSTTSGDWLDRIVAHGLGTRSLAELALTGDGVTVRRPGARSFLIPAGALRGARLDKGIAGKVVTEGGLLVITWEHGGRLLDSGFRSDHPVEHPAWVTAVNALTGGQAGDEQAAAHHGAHHGAQHHNGGAR
jgi:hypothetical protein